MIPVLKELTGRFETADDCDNNIDGNKALSAKVLKEILKFNYGARLKGMHVNDEEARPYHGSHKSIDCFKRWTNSMLSL